MCKILLVVLLTTVIVTTKCEENETAGSNILTGQEQLLPRIVGGFDCNPGLVPYLVSLYWII